MRFPPLYQCEICDKAVSVTNVREGFEPTITRSCECPDDTPVLARRKVTLHGVGGMNAITKTRIKVTVSLRQFLSFLTRRSI
jgi:hypothetical protein